MLCAVAVSAKLGRSVGSERRCHKHKYGSLPLTTSKKRVGGGYCVLAMSKKRTGSGCSGCLSPFIASTAALL